MRDLDYGESKMRKSCQLPPAKAGSLQFQFPIGRTAIGLLTEARKARLQYHGDSGLSRKTLEKGNGNSSPRLKSGVSLPNFI